MRRDSTFAAQVLESLTSAVVGVDAEGCVEVMNDGARRLLVPELASAEAALGRPVAQVLAAEGRLVALLHAALEGRAPMSRAEVALEGGGTAGLTVGPVRDADGRVVGSVLLLRDLTPYERSDERERLQERLAALGEMAAGMAHEIRNPLAGMEVMAGLLRRRLSGEPHELAAEISEQIRLVAETVSACLDFVRPLETRATEIEVPQLIEEALRRGSSRARLDLEVERDFSPSLPPLRGDLGLLTTALASLVANACEVMSAGDRAARLILRARGREVLRGAPRERARAGELPTERAVAAGPEVVISIEDSGPGIPESEHERIFYPFYTTKRDGSGIGLAQAQKIVLAHGGGIRVESGPGRGAVFHVHLPGAEREG